MENLSDAQHPQYHLQRQLLISLGFLRTQTRVHVIFDDLSRNKSIFKANLCITY